MAEESYGEAYYGTSYDKSGVPYDRSHPHWLRFFGNIAKNIMYMLSPSTVMDVGCAKGFLVESLRDLGIEAYGVDFSSYAVGEVREDIRAFCTVKSGTESFGRSFDLVTCIEVLEHLSPTEGEQVIENICRHTNWVLFSSSPSDFDEPTHVNVRPLAYWIKLFNKYEFSFVEEFDASFIAEHAALFCRRSLKFQRMLGPIQDRHASIELRRYLPTRSDVLVGHQRAKLLKNGPQFSLIVPTYNTDVRYLQKALKSVVNQTYSSWEICVYDDGSTRSDLLLYLSHLQSFPRMNVTIGQHVGIGEASNCAAANASGDYLVFLDHDDELHPNALLENAEVLQAYKNVDVIYSDEASLEENGRIAWINLKPDWSPRWLLEQNYITHLMVVRRALFDKIGGFRAGFDGSQDHDLILRLGEQTAAIHHIPRVLYYWYQTETSVSRSSENKSYAFHNGMRAVSEALKRRGFSGTVTESRVNKGIYDVEFEPSVRSRFTLVVINLDGKMNQEWFNDLAKLVSNTKNVQGILLDCENAVQFHPPRSAVSQPLLNDNIYQMIDQVAQGDIVVMVAANIVIDWPVYLKRMESHFVDSRLGVCGVRMINPQNDIVHAGLSVDAEWGVYNPNLGTTSGLYKFNVREVLAVSDQLVALRRSVINHMGDLWSGVGSTLSVVGACLHSWETGFSVLYDGRIAATVPSLQLPMSVSADNWSTFREVWKNKLRTGDPFVNIQELDQLMAMLGL